MEGGQPGRRCELDAARAGARAGAARVRGRRRGWGLRTGDRTQVLGIRARRGDPAGPDVRAAQEGPRAPGRRDHDRGRRNGPARRPMGRRQGARGCQAGGRVRGETTRGQG